jgi:hypothetical protein
MKDILVILISLPFMVVYGALLLLLVPTILLFTIVFGMFLGIHAILLMILDMFIFGKEDI